MTHTWDVFRAGGLDQIRPSKAEDLHRIGQLDRKLWVALSCPIAGLEFDSRTLALMDRDQDGRVRVEEVIAAVTWAADRLQDPTIILRGASKLDFTAFSTTESGTKLVSAAKQVLVNLGRAGETAIAPEDTADTARIFAKTAFNGDGVVTPFQISDAELQSLLTDVIAVCGATVDRSGEAGVDLATAEGFAADLIAYEAWWGEGERAAAAGSDTLPLGEATPAAYAALAAVRAKIADWFARIRLAAFDPRAADPLNRDAAAYAAIATRDLGNLGDDIEALPLRRVEPGTTLDLTSGINPAWASRLDAFRTLVVEPLLGVGTTSLTETAFRDLDARFAAFAAWTAGKKGARVEPLGITRIRALRTGNQLARLKDLIAQDKAVAGDLGALDDLARLLLYVRDLGRLLRNYLNFGDFYDADQGAIFQAGTLYIDQRSCNLCVRVTDVAAHSTLAVHSKLCLIYCECTRPGGTKVTIAAAMTQGESDYLMVGRRGVFYDRHGQDWDAIVTKLVDNPISVRQAFWSPYKKFVRLIEEQIEKFAAAKEKAVQDQAAAKAQATTALTTPTDPKKQPFDIARFAGIFAAIGLALGALGAALGALIGGIAKLPWWQQLLVIPGVVLVISLPSMIIAAIKLRQRTLGPLLEGAGWAINGRVKISFALGRALTAMKRLPRGTRRVGGDDPYTEASPTRRLAVVLILAALASGAAVYWFILRPPTEAPTAAVSEVPSAAPATEPIPAVKP